MEVPQLTTIHGAYVYLMGTILVIAAMFALYLVAVYVGLVPGPPELTSGVVVPPR